MVQARTQNDGVNARLSSMYFLRYNTKWILSGLADIGRPCFIDVEIIQGLENSQQNWKNARIAIVVDEELKWKSPVFKKQTNPKWLQDEEEHQLYVRWFSNLAL